MMDRQVIRGFLVKLVGKNISFEDDDSLLTASLIDSLGVTELIVFIEETYKTTLDGDDLTPENLDSVSAIANFLERKGLA